MRSDPVATYRLQVHGGFTLDEAAEVAPYLARLGVSHVYTSPLLQAAPESTHGYDCVDHSQFNGEAGGREGYDRFSKVLKAKGLGHLLDIVPNHMATALPYNRWWWDVLEKGRESLYAGHFDLYWDKVGNEGREVLVLPVLGGYLRHALEDREIKLNRRGTSFYLSYYQQVWPVALPTLAPFLEDAAHRMGSQKLVRAARVLREGQSRLVGAEGARQLEWKMKGTATVLQEDEGAAAAVDEAIEEINANPRVLGSLLDRQLYRLSYWTVSRERLGYRRFFDINDLISLRAEDEGVFADTHRLILDLAAQGLVDGLRVDHIDGLRDPAGYLQRLARAAPGAWILVEKIREPGEALRRSWPVAGTTGYDFLNKLGGLFVDPSGEKVLTDIYVSFTGEEGDYAQVLRKKKLQVLREVLSADVERLLDLLHQASLQKHFDFVRDEIREALNELAACFPTYRTYVHAGRREIDEEDVKVVRRAIGLARENRPDLPAALLDFIADVLLLRAGGPLEGEFIMRFQQLTGPAMAKGAEDTAFYCYNRLISLNEVGGSPGRFGTSVEDFHQACIERQKRWPLSLLATATHDTKRGEDARTRISLLSEMPELWGEAVRRWSAWNEAYRTGGMPDRNMEYFYYQTLVGAWPLSLERAWGYMEKAAREAKAYTSWARPNGEYESALKAFVEGSMGNKVFMADLEGFLRPLIRAARVSSLSQTLIKITSPGVPDIYQGVELWDLSLVDPDNRRPVDFGLRAKLVDRVDKITAEEAQKDVESGLPKMWVIYRALKVRRRYPRAFGSQGSYMPMAAKGPKAGHVLAFQRGDNVITAAPLRVLSLEGNWEGTVLDLPAGTWRNEFTSEEWRGVSKVEELFHRFPVALLSKAEGSP